VRDLFCIIYTHGRSHEGYNCRTNVGVVGCLPRNRFRAPVAIHSSRPPDNIENERIMIQTTAKPFENVSATRTLDV
jgi:hypothetical protein